MTVIGVLGQPWRATVSPAGTITPWSGAAGELAWWVAAEDRWHDPAHEPDVRQRLVEGTPVVETRVRVPYGDVVHRTYAVADGGGTVVVEVDNESPRSVAVAFSHGGLLTTRPVAHVPIEGITLPAGAVAFPLGHGATLRVALTRDARTGPVPAALPGPLAVARGWRRQVEAASRLVLPDTGLVERVVAARCALLLTGGPGPDDPAGALLGLVEMTRLGGEPCVPEAVTLAERIGRSARTCGLDWVGAQALGAVERMLAAAGDGRAADDVAGLRRRLGGDGAPAPREEPAGIRLVAWTEDRLARPLVDGSCVLLPDGHPSGWLGADWEVHGLPAGRRSRVGYAVRWHGARPAVLWETQGAEVTLVGGVDAPGWRTVEARGDALWPAPPRPDGA